MKGGGSVALWFQFAGCFLLILIVALSCASSGQNAAVGPASDGAPTMAPAAQNAGAVPTSASAAQAPAKAPLATLAPAVDAPKYGGTLVSLGTDPTNFDPGTKGQMGTLFGLVYETYMTTDWTHGEAGGGPSGYYLAGAQDVKDMYYPQIAESWKMPSVGVWVLQIRRGVHWQKPDTEAGRLMNGREATADDVVASLKRLLTAPQSWLNVGQPAVAKAITVERTGPWEVTVKTPVDALTSFYYVLQGAPFNGLFPPEVVAKYGDVADWHNAVGTGPFMLADYTKGSSLTFVKNPDYWDTDPVGPGKGNRLPYVDQYKQLIIPDVSTRLASLRTGKIDYLADIPTEDAQTILKENPRMQNLPYMSAAVGSVNATWGIAMRTDKQDVPFKDKRVRQAMVLATDFQGLAQTLYGGKADYDVWPVSKQTPVLFQPLSTMPQAVQDLYKYNPDKARQLLADAGYSNGFKTNIVTTNDPQLIDELSVYKGMWAKVGIDLTIIPMENAAYAATANARNYDQLIYRQLVNFMPQALYLSPYRGVSTTNASYIDDPVGSVPEIESIYKDVNQNVFVSWDKAYGSVKQLKPLLLEGAYIIPRPSPNVYSMWWPWLKNYYGAGGFTRYAWVDQQLKQSMGH